MSPHARPRVVFLGMEGFGSQVLAHLMQAGVRVVGVVAPAPRVPRSRRAWLLGQVRRGYRTLRRWLGTRFTGLEDLARTAGAPFLQTSNINSPEAIAWLRSRAPDYLCIATFNQLLKPPVLAVPRLGSLNVHPSLLPRFRGPSPLYWQLRKGCSQVGVTVHLVDAGEDTGDIVLQESFPLTDLTSGYDLLARTAQVGGRLLEASLTGLSQGTLTPRPQDPAAASRYPRSRQSDGEVSLDWSPEHMVRFINLAAVWVRPYAIWQGKRLRLSMAESLPEGGSVGLDHLRGRIILPCRGGRITARVHWRDILTQGRERGV